MGNPMSPGVYVYEKDFSTIVPNVAVSIGGIVGEFSQGPLNTPVLVTSVSDLMNIFGLPNDKNEKMWHTAASFLAYANKLMVVNVGTDDRKNASASGTSTVKIGTYSEYLKLNSTDKSTIGQYIALQQFNVPVGTQALDLGNSLAVVMVDASTWANWLTYEQTLVSGSKLPLDPRTGKANRISYAWTGRVADAKLTTSGPNRVLSTNPSVKDEVFLAVIDSKGLITGTPNTVLDAFRGSKLKGTIKTKDSSGNLVSVEQYIGNVVNADLETSMNVYATNKVGKFMDNKYIVWNEAPAGSAVTATSSTTAAWGANATVVNQSGSAFTAIQNLTEYQIIQLSGGSYGTAAKVGDAQIKAGYDLFANPDEIQVNLLLTANYSTSVIRYVVEEVAYQRKDAMVFVSLTDTDGNCIGESNGVVEVGATYTQDLIDARNALGIADMFGSYVVVDSGHKQIFDRFRPGEPVVWVPLNGDIAGLCARTETTNDAWWSPAGFNRGGIIGVNKLSFNPNFAQRDLLYVNQINPVCQFAGQGTILYGDKTLQTKPSAFDRINVRRLFIILEKAISIAAKYSLFEFNDSFTRNQFKNMVEPFLRDIQGRRGIYEFLVVCDESNNTGEVIDRNEFVADIYIKPTRSINYIKLNFIATKTGVDFSTVFGG